MIKLTRKENELLEELWVKSGAGKIKAIKEIYSGKSQVLSNNTLLKLTQAILDGEWEVEEPLYYVKLLDDTRGYLNICKYSVVKILSTKYESETYKTEFTRSEVEAIDPRYLDFLEEVE